MLRLEEADEPALSQETPWQLHSVPYSTTTTAAPVHPVLRVLSRGSEWGVEHEVGTAGLGGGSSDEEQLLALALIAARTVAMDPPSSPCARGISPVAPDNIWLGRSIQWRGARQSIEYLRERASALRLQICPHDE